MPTQTKSEIALQSLQHKQERDHLRKLKALNKKLLSTQKVVTKLKTKGKLKTKTQLMGKLWKLISPIVRTQRSACYTCDTELEFSKRSAGHFWTKKGHPSVRFDFDNLRTQCDDCNRFKSGNCSEYAVRLLDELGYDRFQALRLKAGQSKVWQRQELEDMIEIYKIRN